MATKLKGLKITSTDLVDQGANPDAHIRLFKRKDTPDGARPDDGLVKKIAAAVAKVFGSEATEPVAKEAATFDENIAREELRHITGEMFDFCYALSDSLCSIICDPDIDDDAKRDLMFTSIDEFTEAALDSIPNWAQGKSSKGKKDGGTAVVKSAEHQAAYERLMADILPPVAKAKDSTDPNTGGAAAAKTDDDPDKDIEKQKQTEEDIDTMKIDKSKLTPEEQETLADLEKRYGVDDAPPAPPAAEPPAADVAKNAELHPEVKKALDEFDVLRKAQTAEIEELKKNLEIEKLTGIAKKYEIIGKKADELAPKLYEMKKAGGTVYDDYVALLDESVTTVEKGGLFGEFGKNTSGGGEVSDKIGSAAAEVKKAANIGNAEAIVKAWEDNPELAAQYEREYNGGRS